MRQLEMGIVFRVNERWTKQNESFGEMKKLPFFKNEQKNVLEKISFFEQTNFSKDLKKIWLFC